MIFEAILACTLTARALGLDEDLGSVAPAKLADPIVVEGEPAADIAVLGRTKIVHRAGACFSPDELRESVVGTIE